MVALSQAHKILDWFENLSGDEIPPEWMWPFDDELEVHFQEVEARRNEKYGVTSSGGDVDGGPMMANELAQGMRG